MKAIIRAIWQLTTYALVGVIPSAITVILYLTGTTNFPQFIATMLLIDVTVCKIAHQENRTLSDLTGERALTKPRYKLQAKVIDLLAYPFEKQWNHCKRALSYAREINYKWLTEIEGL